MRRHVLADAALADEEHGHVRVRDAMGERPDPLHRARERGRHLGVGVRLGRPRRRFLGSAPAGTVQRPAEHEIELVHLEGLRQVVDRAELHRPHDVLCLGEPGHHDHRHAGIALVQPAQDLEPIRLRDDEVEEHGVRWRRLGRGQRLRASPRGLRSPARGREVLTEGVPCGVVVLDDEHVRVLVHPASVRTRSRCRR
jgi:hypothetical protein